MSFNHLKGTGANLSSSDGSKTSPSCGPIESSFCSVEMCDDEFHPFHCRVCGKFNDEATGWPMLCNRICATQGDEDDDEDDDEFHPFHCRVCGKFHDEATGWPMLCDRTCAALDEADDDEGSEHGDESCYCRVCDRYKDKPTGWALVCGACALDILQEEYEREHNCLPCGCKGRCSDLFINCTG